MNILKYHSDISDNGRPSFDDFNLKNITSPIDKLVTLKCTVKNKGNRTVSQITIVLVLRYYFIYYIT